MAGTPATVDDLIAALQTRGLLASLRAKGDPVLAFYNFQQTNLPAAGYIDSVPIDCRNFNAVALVTTITGTNPQATFTVMGSEDPNGVYLPLPDPAATQTITGDIVMEAPVSTHWAKLRLTNLTGAFGVGQGFTVAAVPYFSAGVTNVSVSNTANQNLAQIGGTNVGATNPLPVDLVVAGAAIDPRDVSDRAGRALGAVSLAAQSVTISTIEQKVRAGQAFVWSPGRIAAAANEHARLLVQNPNGSGKTVFVYARFLTLDVQAVCVVSLFRSPSVGTPALGAAGAGIANQLLGSGTTSVAQVGADHSATAMAAGTGAALTTEAGVGIGRQAYPAPLYEIPANQSLGIDVLVSAAATGVIPELYSWEE